jgi:hypothetical protein
MLDVLNNSKLFLGTMLILLNLGGKYLVDELSTSEEEYSRNLVLRRIAVFAVCFVGTRDVITSLILTAAFIIIASGVSKNRPEGMRNKEEKKKPMEADNPGYDTSAPLLF